MESTEFLLCVAHCDDTELWAGGTIAGLVKKGKRVVSLVAYHNDIRRNEALASAATLGYEVRFKEKSVSLFDWIFSCLNELRPEVIATHPFGDPHFEHDEVSREVSKVLTKSDQRKSYPIRWYWFDTYYSTESKGHPLLIDISDYFELKISALQCHQSQSPNDLIKMARTMNALHGIRIRAEYAEAFYTFPLLGRIPRLREFP
jgi:LmbE family N-acetylglucosaminyl deacetylase